MESQAFCSPEMVAGGRPLAEPRLAPDGCAVVFSTTGPLGTQLVRIDLTDSDPPVAGPEVVLVSNPAPAGVHPEGGGSFCWSPDGRSIVFAARDGGLYRVARDGGPVQCVAVAPDADHWFGSPELSPDGLRLLCTLNSDESNLVVVCPVDGVGEAMTVSPVGSADFRVDPTWIDNETVAWHEWSDPFMPWDGSRIVAVRPGDQPSEVAPRTVAGGAGASVSQPRGMARPGYIGWLGEDSGFANVTLGVVTRDLAVTPLDRITEPNEHGGPTWGSGSRTWCWSPDGGAVAFSRNEAGFGMLCTTAVAPIGSPGADTGRSVSGLGRGVHHGLSWARTPGGRERIAAVRTGGRTPTQLVVYDRVDSSSPSRTVIARGPVGGWEDLDTPEPTQVTWMTGDLGLHGRLYLPNGETPRAGWPLIVSVHGGPTGQTLVQFNARFAYWLAAGWAVFVPDYRGTTGWGQDYRRALNGWWGERDALDVLGGLDHVLSVAPIDGSRVVAMGGSAGGFTVLGLIASSPERFAAAVILYPVTDLDLLDATTHRYERHYNAALVGPKPESAPLYRLRSPVEYADRIQTPLLILHGDADKTVDVGQSRELVRRMHGAGANVAFHCYEGEGHGWKKAETTVDEIRRIDAFIARYGAAGV